MIKLKNIYVYLKFFGFSAWVSKIFAELKNIFGINNAIVDLYLDPWEIDFKERLQDLSKGKIKIAYYYGKQPDSSSYRYRVYNMAKVLQTSKNNISASFFHLGDLENLEEVTNIADVLVLCRVAYCDKINNAISLARSSGKKILYDIDDLTFDAKYVHLTLETIGANIEKDDTWNYWYGDFSRRGAVLMLCDKVITTNEYLADKIREFSGKTVSIVPNYLNQGQLDISRNIFQKKRSDLSSNDQAIILGYFSGTNTHNVDFKLLTDALIEVFEKYDNIKLHIVGLIDLDEKLAAYSNRIECFPLQNYIDLQNYISEVHINLIPLQDNAYTNSKSEIKYFEAGIVGTVSIASPTYVYRNCIKDGHNGFLANSQEWAHKIEELLNNNNEYQNIAERAYRDAEQHYSCEKMLNRIEKALFN